MESNCFRVEVFRAGLRQWNNLFVPFNASTRRSESSTISRLRYRNDNWAWDHDNRKLSRNPALSVFNTYKSCRESQLEMPPTVREAVVYKAEVASEPKESVQLHDPGLLTPKPIVVFVLGGPGAGKGTMCELAELQLGWVHLSIGELLREEHLKQNSDAVIIAQSMAEGKLVPNAIIVSLLKETMKRITQTTGMNHFLLDGFPRSLGNLNAWQQVFGQQLELPTMLYFECPLAELQRRILGRAPFSGRSDDNLESMKLRFETFRAETLPIVNHFKDQGKCLEIDTSLDRQVVYELLRQHLAGKSNSDDVNRPLCERAEILLGLRPYPKLLS